MIRNLKDFALMLEVNTNTTLPEELVRLRVESIGAVANSSLKKKYHCMKWLRIADRNIEDLEGLMRWF